MELSERKLRILNAIVRDYIETAEAVGSRTLTRKYNFGLSPATIRNEMADLEDMGFLVQPHTSSGRVPTEKGYKLYVDTMMGQVELDQRDKKAIESVVESNVEHLKDLISETSRMLSQLTNYTTVAMVSNVAEDAGIRHIQLVSMGENCILLIVVTDKGTIKSEQLITKVELKQSKLNIISDNLTKKLYGKSIKELDESLIAYIKYEIGEYSDIVDDLIELLDGGANEVLLKTSGATNIFNYPEFNDVFKARSFLNMLEQKDKVESMINTKGIQKGNLNIVIGSEDSGSETIGCDYSIITATYSVGNEEGKISFIGPTRMDYERIYSIINYMSLLLDKK